MAQNYIVSVINDNEPEKTYYYLGQPKENEYYPQITSDINKAILMPSSVAEYAEKQCNHYPDLTAKKHQVSVQIRIID